MMLRSHFSWAVLLLASVLPAQGKLVKGVHQDPVNGYQIGVPKRWTMVPVKIDEKWIVAKYLCHREYSNKGSGWAVSHTPEMKVLTFTSEKAERKEERQTEGNTTYIRKDKVFRSYDDYLREYMKGIGLGYHIVSDEQDEIDGAQVRKIKIAAKNDYTTINYITWIFERPQDDQTIAVEFDALKDRLHTLEKDFTKSLKSFEFIDMSESGGTADLENPMWTRDRSKWVKKKSSDRIKIRKEIEEKRRDLYISTAPEGWYTMTSKSGDYVALSHADKRYTKHVLAAADAMRAWMDKRFGKVTDEYVMTGILRICDGYDEFNSYRDTSAAAGARAFSSDDREIVDYKDKGSGTSGGGLGLVAGGLYDNYLYDKDTYLYGYLPTWLDFSLRSYFGDAVLKGKKLVFKPSTAENVRIKEAEREDQLVTLQVIMGTPYQDWPKDRDEYYRYMAQCLRAARFLIDGPGKKDKLLKDFVPKYMVATIDAAEEWNKTRRGSRQAQTVEEEEAQKRQRAEYWKKRRKFILEKVNEECLNFTQKEWDKLNKLFHKYVTK